MKEFLILFLFIFPSLAQASVPYYKTRYEDGRECRYNYSGVQNGQEQLVNVQCF